MNNPKSENVEIVKTEGRRRFLKRSATGVVLASLPAASAWGTGTSCSVSGNLSTHGSSTACDTPNVNFAGRSGGFWKSLRSGQVRSAFYSINSKNAARNIAIPHIRKTIKNAGLEYALQGGGIEKQLASAYLNAFYGFYTLPAGMSAQAYTDNLRQQMNNGTYSTDDLIRAIEATHVDGVSNYSFPRY
jgi:hypothetical protein